MRETGHKMQAGVRRDVEADAMRRSTRRRLLIALGALAIPGSSFAQKPISKIPHIGYLSTGSIVSNGAFLGAFKDGLRELGWVDGKNIIIDARWAGTAAYEFPQLAASLVKEKPDAIVGTCVPSTRAAKNATSSIPVVMSVNGDPVASGLVASLAHPGGNVTGTSTLFEQLIPKWLELITTALPKARTIAVLVNSESLSDPFFWTQFQEIAKRMGVKVVSAEARAPTELERAFADIKKQRAGAFVMMTDAFWAGQMQRILTLANVYKLPGIYGFREFAEAGGLMSYGLSYREYYKGVARYVDKVLKGVKPADLPVEQPTRIEFVINQSTAKSLGLNLPGQLLVRADKVIE
jgi:putative tryptophan/tyrosine transport system substrate-binding protein